MFHIKCTKQDILTISQRISTEDVDWASILNQYEMFSLLELFLTPRTNICCFSALLTSVCAKLIF
jgi:hypothetical protein